VKNPLAGEESAEPAGEQETVSVEGLRLMLAEDIEINAEILMELLTMEGIEAERAENGEAAVSMFAEHAEYYYDAILMDVRMPVMDGLTAAKVIRDMDRADAKTIPIIALTANAFEEDVQQSVQAGMNAHLSKPVEMDRLLETLRTLAVRRQPV
jgi:CheY-like chemotaxis protein